MGDAAEPTTLANSPGTNRGKYLVSTEKLKGKYWKKVALIVWNVRSSS